jgi:hypothetical protein
MLISHAGAYGGGFNAGGFNGGYGSNGVIPQFGGGYPQQQGGFF